jgi:hypothetical protein
LISLIDNFQLIHLLAGFNIRKSVCKKEKYRIMQEIPVSLLLSHNSVAVAVEVQ